MRGGLASARIQKEQKAGRARQPSRHFTVATGVMPLLALDALLFTKWLCMSRQSPHGGDHSRAQQSLVRPSSSMTSCCSASGRTSVARALPQVFALLRVWGKIYQDAEDEIIEAKGRIHGTARTLCRDVQPRRVDTHYPIVISTPRRTSRIEWSGSLILPSHTPALMIQEPATSGVASVKFR